MSQQTIILQSEDVLVIEQYSAVGIVTTEIETVLVVQETEVVVLEATEQGPAGPPGGWLGGAELTYQKDPNALNLDYVFDWMRYLGVDTIVSVVWTLSAGITQTGNSFTTKTATVLVSGGTAGNMETIACRITTASGRTDERTISLQIIDR